MCPHIAGGTRGRESGVVGKSALDAASRCEPRDWTVSSLALWYAASASLCNAQSLVVERQFLSHPLGATIAASIKRGHARTCTSPRPSDTRLLHGSCWEHYAWRCSAARWHTHPRMRGENITFFDQDKMQRGAVRRRIHCSLTRWLVIRDFGLVDEEEPRKTASRAPDGTKRRPAEGAFLVFYGVF